MEHDPLLRVIRRYDEPTKLDTANYLTLCCVGSDDQKPSEKLYFIQMSKHPEEPRWILLGYTNENTLIRLIDLLSNN